MTVHLLLVFLAFLSRVQTGNVGMCRTECIEHNVSKIVRVHLKDDLVMAGLCVNRTDLSGSIVTPYVCHRNVGLWSLDELDEEGVTAFEKLCPTPDVYSLETRENCPRLEESRDVAGQKIERDDVYPGSGQTPPSS